MSAKEKEGEGGKMSSWSVRFTLENISLEREREKERKRERETKKKKGERNQYVVCSCHSREYLSRERKSVCASNRAKRK